MVLKSDGYSSDHIRLNRFVFWSSAVGIGILAYYLCCFRKKSVLADLCARAGKPLFRVVLHVGDCAVFGFVAWLAFKSGTDSFRKDHDKPEFGYLAWTSMLFSAGIGIALLYYGVAEPVDHFLRPPEGEAGTIQAARNAMTYSFCTGVFMAGCFMPCWV